MKTFLHYVGAGIYGMDAFAEEAKKIGVHRSIGFNKLKLMEWSDEIFLAEHRKNKRGPYAIVFGYFRVSGISYTLPDEIKKEVIENLDIVRIDESTSGKIQRECGSYVEGVTTYVNNTLQEILAIIQRICLKHDLDVNDYKYFVAGKFVGIEAKRLGYGATFFRGYKEIAREVVTEAETIPEDEHFVSEILQDTYQKKNYKTKSLE